MSMAEYTVEFDQRYTKIKKYEMALPDAVLAFKLLDNGQLSKAERQLALTACTELTYTNMKSALKRVFGDSKDEGHQAKGGDPILVKKEEAYYTRQNRNYRGSNYRQFSRPTPKLKGTNPLNKFGKYTKCNLCQSIFHWVKDCPHKSEAAKLVKEKQESDEEDSNLESCNITLFTQAKLSENEVFVVESQDCAVTDTACTKTVCGDKWLNHYLESLNCDNRLGDVKEYKSNRRFKFGDGNVVKSFKRVIIPAKIGNTSCSIETEVVKSDIPLLLSKASLKKAGAVIDLEKDEAVMFQEPIKLQFTSSGHYCIGIINKT